MAIQKLKLNMRDKCSGLDSTFHGSMCQRRFVVISFRLQQNNPASLELIWPEMINAD